MTFEDGRCDNPELALPILERLLITGLLGKARMITKGEIQEFADLGHKIGAHTITHPKLSKAPLEAAGREKWLTLRLF